MSGVLGLLLFSESDAEVLYRRERLAERLLNI
jgi:hypothetical protein